MEIEKIKQKKSVNELLEFSIINIDKPSGPTSFNISDFVRKKLGSLKISNEILAPRNLKRDKIPLVRKTSHFGTLDPKVTGVLPIALNRACKLTGYFIGEDKEYIGIMRIHDDVLLDKIKKMIKEKFVGKIKQTPPVKSRVKRQEREREIKKFEILEKSGKDILFRVECQGGTYIRKLVDDLGKELGVGAHMLELRRVRAGIFTEENCVNLYDFEKAVSDEKLLKEILIPAEIITKLYPVVQVKKESMKKLLTGKAIFKEDIDGKIPAGEKFIAFSDDKFIGIYRKVEEGDKIARPEFVLQDLR